MGIGTGLSSTWAYSQWSLDSNVAPSRIQKFVLLGRFHRQQNHKIRCGEYRRVHNAQIYRKYQYKRKQVSSCKCIVNSEFIDWTVVCVHFCVSERGRIQTAIRFTAIIAFMALAYGNDTTRCWTFFFCVLTFRFCFSHSSFLSVVVFFFLLFSFVFEFISRSLSATFCRFGFVLYSFDFVLRFIAVVVVVVTILKCRSIQHCCPHHAYNAVCVCGHLRVCRSFGRFVNFVRFGWTAAMCLC